MFILAGVFLIGFGSIIGVLLNPYGFPWGAVIAISAGTWSLLTGLKMSVESSVSIREVEDEP